MILDSESNIKLYTEQGWWDEVTIIDYLLRNVEVSPDMVCLVDPPNRTNFTVGEPKRLTWAEVKRAVDNLATGLLELGVKKDSVIQLQMPNITEAPIVYLAAARIGAIVSPLAVQYRDHEVGYAMGLVEPTVYITTTNFNGFNFVDMVEKLRKDVPSLKAIIALGDNLPEGVLSLTEIIARDTDGKALEDYLSKTTLSAYEIFTICWTSGTEATPKGVPRSQNSWKVVSLSLIDPCGIEEEDNLILTFPLINMASLAGNFFPWLSQL